MNKKTQHGGKREGAGRPPKPPGEKYQQYPLKLPPGLIRWLEENTDNRNGFIVKAIRERIKRITER